MKQCFSAGKCQAVRGLAKDAQYLDNLFCGLVRSIEWIARISEIFTISTVQIAAQGQVIYRGKGSQNSAWLAGIDNIPQVMN